MVSSHQGQARPTPVVLSVFLISMTLSFIFYLSIIWSILRLCSEFRAFNSFGIAFLHFSGIQPPRTGQGWDKPRTSGPWCICHLNIYDSICHFLSISHIVHPAPLLGVWCGQRYFAVFFCASVVSSYQGQAKADTNQGPAVLGALASGPCLAPIIKPAVFNGSPP